MNILFDLRATQPLNSKYHGGGEYAKVLFKRLLEMKGKEDITSFYLQEYDLSKGIQDLAKRYKIKMVPINSLNEIEHIIIEGNFDRLYSALPYEYYNLDLSSIKFLCTIHGLRPIEQPTDKYEYKYCTTLRDYGKYLVKYLFTLYYKKIKRNQFESIFRNIGPETIIIVPSNHTKFSIMSQFPYLTAEQIEIYYSPLKKQPTINKFSFSTERIRKFGVQSGNYFLLTGAERFVKNSYRAIRALDEIFTDFDDVPYKVLVLGTNNERLFQNSIKNKDRFEFRGYVSDDELNLLYHEAFAFIYPTLNEGFGYPPLESMRYGTPVLASAVTSVTEVCGDAVLYFNPFSIEEIKIRLLSIIRNKSLRQKYSKRGFSQFKKISKQQEKMLDELCELILGRC